MLRIRQSRGVSERSVTYGDFLESYIWRQSTNEDLAARLPGNGRRGGSPAVAALPRWRWSLGLRSEDSPLCGAVGVYPAMVSSL